MLHTEFTQTPTISFNTDPDTEDILFSTTDDKISHVNGSEIPLNAVQLFVTTGACSAGFLDGAGSSVCSWIAEVLDQGGDVAIPIVTELGHGCRMRTRNTKYRADWEQH